MIRLSTFFKAAAMTILLAGVVLVTGCSLLGTKGGVTTASMQGQFDATIKSYKDGQFLVDGAVLSAMDTGSHFAYLKDQGKLPKTILLERSDESKIRKQHLQYMARMQIDYGMRVYYDDGGTLKEINPLDTKARQLEDSHEAKPARDDSGDKDAGHTGYDPSRQQQY